MNVTIHQPYFVPYIGFFSKVFKSDVLVLYDTAQYVKNRLDNRNYINYKNQKKLLTVPIAKHMSFKPLSEVLISNHYDWRDEHLSMLDDAYSNYDYYNLLMNDISDIYSRKYTFLSEINSVFIIKILSLLGWKGNVIYSSDMEIDQNLNPSEKLLNILLKTNAKTYIAGPSSREYLDFSLFDIHKISVEIHNYKYKHYPQQSTDFIPNLSILDYMYNCGVKDLKGFL
jgi:hypothetical protein